MPCKIHIAFRLSGVICAAALVGCTATPPPSLRVQAPLQPYAAILAKLKDSKIPVLLPSAAMMAQYLTQQPLSLQSIKYDRRHTYMVYFDNTPGCHGAPICTQGAMYATSRKSPAPFNNMLNFRSDTHLHHYPVQLVNGMTGRMEEDTENRIYRSLLWQENGVRYELSMKNQPDTAFIATANSAIAAGDRLQPLTALTAPSIGASPPQHPATIHNRLQQNLATPTSPTL